MGVRTAITVIAILTCALPAWAGKYTPEQIRRAVKDLGDRRFVVREKASRLLWDAGADAEGPLQAALKSGDPEAARRARSLLDKFQWGIFPDTPAAVVELIGRYRNGDRNVRMQVVAKLTDMGQPGFAVVKRLADMETDVNERQAIYSKLAENAQRAVPSMLLAGKLDVVEDLLERCLLGDSDAAYANFATYHFLRGTLDSAIAKARLEWDRSRSKSSGKLLIHLFRAKADFAKAGAIAREINDEGLAEQLLWEEGNWKGLAAHARKVGLGPRDASKYGTILAFARLAGDVDLMNNAIARLKEMAQSSDGFEAQTACESLLLNGRHADALPILIERKKPIAFTFDLLALRMQYAEAFALARDAKPVDKEEQFALDLRRARLLHQLGETETALKQLRQLGDNLNEAGESNAAHDLIKAMVGLGLKDQAAEICARYLGRLQQQNMTDGFARLFEPLFGKDSEAADIWWNFLRRQQPNEDPVKTISAMRRLFAGKPVEQRDEWARVLADRTVPLERVPIKELGPEANPKLSAAGAAAIAMERAGEMPKAEAYLRKAAALRPDLTSCMDLGDFLARQGRYSDAAAMFARAAKADRASALAVFLRGWALKHAGDEKDGGRLMDLAHWIPLGNERDRGEFAKELDRRGFADDARRERDLVLQAGWYRSWHVGNVLDVAGRLALKTRDYDRTILYYEKAIAGCMRQNARFVEYHSYLDAPQSVVQVRIQQLLAEKKFDEAVAQIRVCLDALPGNIKVLSNSIPLLDEAGKKREADELFNEVSGRLLKAVGAYPNSAFLHNSYAWLAATCRRDLDQALQHAQKAVRLSTSRTDYLDTLAEIYFRKGNIAKAKEIMKKCIELDANQAYLKKQLARFEKGDVKSMPPEEDE